MKRFDWDSICVALQLRIARKTALLKQGFTIEQAEQETLVERLFVIARAKGALRRGL